MNAPSPVKWAEQSGWGGGCGRRTCGLRCVHQLQSLRRHPPVRNYIYYTETHASSWGLPEIGDFEEIAIVGLCEMNLV